LERFAADRPGVGAGNKLKPGGGSHATFAIAPKYTPETLAAVRKAGFASREPAMKALAEQFGGKFVAVYWLASPDWDYVSLIDLPSADNVYAIMSFDFASGAFLKGNATQLRTSAEADAAIARQLTWTPPGS
jgi:uncharacterized protein with GYD domain